MKIIKLFNLLSFLFVFSSIYGQGIQFATGSWEEIKAKAKNEGKAIFFDAYTSWCGPCKAMTKNVFSKEEVGNYFNEKFIAYKVDMEKGEGPALGIQFGVKAYPTLLFFSSNGELVHQAVGGKNVESLIRLAKEALDPKKQLGFYEKEYELGNRDKDFLAQYSTLLMEANFANEEVFTTYWPLLTKKEKISENNFFILLTNTNYFRDIEAPLTQFFLSNREEYIKVVSKAESSGQVQLFETVCYTATLRKIAAIKDSKIAAAKLKELIAYFPDKKKEYKKRLTYIRTVIENPTDSIKIAKTLASYTKVSCDEAFLKNKAYQACQNKDYAQALKLTNRAEKLSKDYFNYSNCMVKTTILYNMGNYEEALDFVEKTIVASSEVGFEKTPQGWIDWENKIKAQLVSAKEK
jgi:thiol-disulfide isomerase/thioredoxin